MAAVDGSTWDGDLLTSLEDPNVLAAALTAEDALLAEFCAKWGLRVDAQEMLLSLPAELQRKVMAEFNPRDSTRDANNIFMKFATGISQASNGAGELEAFVARWNLGDEAQTLLLGLKPPLRLRVMTEFAPRDMTTDVNNIFLKFATGVAIGKGSWKGKGSWGGKGAYVNGVSNYASQGTVRQAVQPGPVPTSASGRNYMSESMQQQQQQLQQQQQQLLLQEQQLQRQQQLLQQQQQLQQQGSSGFVNSLQIEDSEAASLDASTTHFVTKWSLQSEAQELLASLPLEIQQKVMRDFSPRDTSRDVNGIFLKFAASVRAGQWQQQAYPEETFNTIPSAWQQRNLVSKGVSQEVAGDAIDQDVDTFVTQWSLGQEALQLLSSMTPEQRLKVMSEFNPRDATTDVNNIFLKFGQGVVRGSAGKSKGKGKSTWYNPAASPNAMRMSPY
eukprot:TRINITY_DN5113_c0_g3_i1.p1 TRINITY_DN5113_c0_g3~~TRINITY_DN5113_c0_g3_i1.p1  ORF type:complete len:444 (-),score=111.02 TRINITY_DN5113_c0_g3_i1:103-1434(-)